MRCEENGHGNSFFNFVSSTVPSLYRCNDKKHEDSKGFIINPSEIGLKINLLVTVSNRVDVHAEFAVVV